MLLEDGLAEAPDRAMTAHVLRVLVVEDSPEIGRATSRLLHRRDCTVVVATTAGEARATLAIHTFDAVLCDYNLETETSEALLVEIADAHPHVRRVLYTGSDVAHLDHLLARGAVHAILEKTVPLEELIAELHRA